MYDKLENSTADKFYDKNLGKNLFHEFENPVDSGNKFQPCLSILNSIDNSIENVMDDLVIGVINAEPSLTNSKNIHDFIKSIDFFLTSNFGTFEYLQKTGKNIFKVEHCMGVNHSNFLVKLFERVFEICFDTYSLHVISNPESVCVIFR